MTREDYYYYCSACGFATSTRTEKVKHEESDEHIRYEEEVIEGL